MASQLQSGGGSSSKKRMDSKKKGAKGGSQKPEVMLSPVYDQPGDTCTLIAIVGVIEAIYNKELDEKHRVVLSVEDLVEWFLQKRMMKGGVTAVEKVYHQIIKIGGLAKVDDAASDCIWQFAVTRQKEIKRAEQGGKERREEKREVTIKGFTIMKPKDEEKLIEILSKHPVVGIVEVYPSFNDLRGGEVYTGPTEKERRSKVKPALHAVQVYDYVNLEETGAFWNVKNSYGTTWSNNGYGKIATSVPFVSLSYPTGVGKSS